MAGDKVINFSKGSKFYFEIGNYYYLKNNLDKALVYYQRALAVDPANPVNHFNLACLLSELGKYRESTQILKKVTEMDSGLSESWFWLAMNHGQLQQYREACRYLRKYLEQEPDGEYSWQAEEILDYMRSDLPMLSPGQRDKIDSLCAKGIELINQGHLQEAIKCFTRASDIEPELTAPLNNLALSWFYLGEIGKAMELTKEILAREPNNVFANCNLVTFYYIIEDELAVHRQVRVLDGLWGEDPEEMLKLGTTYGLLGIDKKALNVFRFLHASGIRSFELLLLLGIAYYNCGQIIEAKKLFIQVNELEPENPYSDFLFVKKNLCPRIPYHLRVPDDRIAVLLDGEPGPEDIEAITCNPELWPKLMWIVRRGNSAARYRLVRAMVQTGCRELVDVLIQMAWKQGTEVRCRQDIFSVLADSGIDVWHSSYWSTLIPEKPAHVLSHALDILDQRGCGFTCKNKAYLVWMAHWLRKRPRIRNASLWSAALVVIVLGLDVLKEIAATFEIAPHSLYRAVRQLTGLYSHY